MSLPGSVLADGPSLAPGRKAVPGDETAVRASDRSRGAAPETPGTGSSGDAAPEKEGSAAPSRLAQARRAFVPSMGIEPGPEEGHVPWGLVGTVLLGVLGFAGTVPAALQVRRRRHRRLRPRGAALRAHGPIPVRRRPAALPRLPARVVPAPDNVRRNSGDPPVPSANGNGRVTDREISANPPAPEDGATAATPRPPAPAARPPHRPSGADRVALPTLVDRDAQRHRSREEEPAPAPPAGPDRYADRVDLADRIRTLRVEVRLATVSLTLLPALVVVGRAVADSTYLPRLLTSVLGILVLLTATALSVAGALWLDGLRTAPLPAWPWRRREHARQWETEVQLASVLGVAAGLAGPGRSLGDAVTDAVEREQTPTAIAFRGDLERRGLPGLAALRTGPTTGGLAVHPAGSTRGGHPAVVTACARAVEVDIERGAAPHVALASAAAQLRHALERRVAHRQARLPVSALLPFAACLLPATILLAIVGW